MGRQIRMTSAQALAAGLLDPDLADLAKPKGRRKGTRNSALEKADATTRDGSATCGSPKKKRSRSRPASHPKPSPGPQGTGSVECLATGEVHAASFWFNVVPVPKERAQIVRNPKTDKVVGFTPARTSHFHRQIKAVVREVMGNKEPVAGPVRLEMTFVMQVPKSWPKWKQAAALEGLIAPTGRPDMDNLEKALLDAFNGVLVVDDAFVVERLARKIYGKVPAIEASVRQTGTFDIHAKRQAVETLRRLKETENNHD